VMDLEGQLSIAYFKKSRRDGGGGLSKTGRRSIALTRVLHTKGAPF